MKAEFEKRTGTLMLYPFRPDVWRNEGAIAQSVFLQLAFLIAEFEPVFLGILESLYSQVAPHIQHPNLQCFPCQYNDAWARDISPVFLKTDLASSTALNFKFNGWGNRIYSDYDQDQNFASRFCERFNISSVSSSLCMEGGNLDSNGDGLLLTTAQCLFDRERNQLSQEQTLKLIKQELKVKEMILLPEGLFKDETYGHIDNLARFVSQDKILLAWTEDLESPNFEITHRALDALIDFQQQGLKFEIIKIPLPNVQSLMTFEAEGILKGGQSLERNISMYLNASYLNFYMGERFVIVPTFHHPLDYLVLEQFKRLFPNKMIVPFYSREILIGGGNIHCITAPLFF